MVFRFNSLENEVRKRDEIISQLQKRIQELERLGLGSLPAPVATEHSEELDSQDENDIVLLGHDSYSEKHQQSKNSSGSEEMSGVEEGFMVTNLFLFLT